MADVRFTKGGNSHFVLFIDVDSGGLESGWDEFFWHWARKNMCLSCYKDLKFMSSHFGSYVVEVVIIYALVFREITPSENGTVSHSIQVLPQKASDVSTTRQQRAEQLFLLISCIKLALMLFVCDIPVLLFI